MQVSVASSNDSGMMETIFNGFSSTVPHSNATWRDGLLSDWIVVVRDQTFLLHRYVLGLGIRSSAYFYNQFHFNQTPNSNRSVLEIGRALLCTCCSESCHCPDTTVIQMEDIDRSIQLYFPDVLEYMYEGTIQFTEDNVACVYAIADFLQIGNLLACMEDDIFDLISKGNVIRILMAAEKVRLHSGVIIRQCVELLAKSFLDFPFEESSKIPATWLHQIFSHQDCVLSKDHIVRYILRLLRENGKYLSSTDVMILLLSIADHKFEVSGPNALYLLALTETFMQAQFNQGTRDNHLPSLRLLQDRCYDILAWNFFELPSNSLSSVSVDCLLHLLNRDDLHILSEDQIYDHICQYMDANPILSDEEALSVWKTCRFALLSAETLWRAQTSAAPKNLVLVGAILAGAMHKNEPFLNTISKDISGKVVPRRIVCPMVGMFAAIPDFVMAVLPVDNAVKHLMSNQFVTYPARGSVECNSSLHAMGWRFKICAASTQGMMIGLISAPNGPPRASTSRLGNSSTRSWAFQCQTGKKLHNGKLEQYGSSPCADGDVIDMVLSCDESGQGTVTFFKNGQTSGIAFTGIRGHVAPAVTLFRRNQQISMSLCRPTTF